MFPGTGFNRRAYICQALKLGVPQLREIAFYFIVSLMSKAYHLSLFPYLFILGWPISGRNVEELPEVRKSQPGSTYLDAYPLIWNRFEQNGYAPLLAEDEPTLSVFNLRYSLP